MNTSMAARRESCERIYRNLASIQRNYNYVAQFLSKEVASVVPANQEDVENMDAIEEQIKTANQMSFQIEELKYYCSLAIVSDGVLIKEDEMSYALDIIDAHLSIADLEIESDDSYLREWAETKREHYVDVESVLLAILNDKIDHQVNLNKKEAH
jgi:hypothetical protein